MKHTDEQELILIANRAGVELDSARKVLKSFSLHFILKLLDTYEYELENRRNNTVNELIDINMDIKVPYLLENLTINLKEIEQSDGRKLLNIDTSSVISDFVKINIEQLLNASESELRKMLKLQILEAIIA